MLRKDFRVHVHDFFLAAHMGRATLLLDVQRNMMTGRTIGIYASDRILIMKVLSVFFAYMMGKVVGIEIDRCMIRLAIIDNLYLLMPSINLIFLRTLVSTWMPRGLHENLPITPTLMDLPLKFMRSKRR